jgi:hypothetical protein
MASSACCPFPSEAVEISNPGKIGVDQDASGNPTMFPDRNTAIDSVPAALSG